MSELKICPLCGRPLENLENIIIRCHNQRCAVLGSADLKWWRRLKRQVGAIIKFGPFPKCRDCEFRGGYEYDQEDCLECRKAGNFEKKR